MRRILFRAGSEVDSCADGYPRRPIGLPPRLPFPAGGSLRHGRRQVEVVHRSWLTPGSARAAFGAHPCCGPTRMEARCGLDTLRRLGAVRALTIFLYPPG
jgi:hypothetical protein